MKFCVFTVAFVVGFVLLALSLCGLASVFNESLFLAKIVFKNSFHFVIGRYVDILEVSFFAEFYTVKRLQKLHFLIYLIAQLVSS